MDMDKTPLNKAHQLERKAEALSRQKKLEECMQCHQEAAELYEKCLQEADADKNALESIQMQKEWNERQIRMLQLKKSYLERTETARKLRVTSSSKRAQNDDVEHLEAKIFKNFETHDSLICYLSQRGIIKTTHLECQPAIEEVEEQEGPFVVGSKHPKNDSIIIEELKELSGQLRDSVQGFLKFKLDKNGREIVWIRERVKTAKLQQKDKEGLLIQLDDRNREIEQLKCQLKSLQLEKSIKYQVTEPSEDSSPLSEELEFQSLPALEVPDIPEIDLSCFKQFRMPEINHKLLNQDD